MKNKKQRLEIDILVHTWYIKQKQDAKIKW